MSKTTEVLGWIVLRAVKASSSEIFKNSLAKNLPEMT